MNTDDIIDVEAGEWTEPDKAPSQMTMEKMQSWLNSLFAKMHRSERSPSFA